MPVVSGQPASDVQDKPVSLHVEDAVAAPKEEPMQAVEASNVTQAKSDVNNAKTEFSTYEEAYEKGKIAGIQEAILAIMEKNGPVTDRMRKDVTDNVYHDSLINWVKSFR